MGSIHLCSSSLSLSSLRGYTSLHCLYPFTLQGGFTDLVLSNPARKLSFKLTGVDRLRASLMSGEGDILSCAENNGVSAQDTLIGKGLNQPSGIELQPDGIGFGKLSAEITPTTTAFSPNDDEYDLDRPTDGFASISEAIEDIHQGKLVIVVDNEDRENAGDIIMAASKATPEAMAFIVKHGTGIVCVSMKGEDLERLELPLMVTQKENEEKLC
ncbi:hypothetical protein MANES_13G097101v8 [Manihot esculenta]|uniref:Uncharacterized protein n=5 Tax=Manihot esculenta TaxID=3983 RepID=A0ACB7GMT6_MANES|nr:hypothetical protein MANES_13G097101v8 [Manihot esculenta]KAG8641037.1 hypothetical protein MANES_13G097101v8 [Manihot esculenta]KAG8641038.1 hypothetical protein MANES_13G097101v8 [Manihot esculenta]KAG8641039.1 hypothetical protein MANES_13G097101v8 [Manihot esculenta]OAY33447.1 hypothetical protein MANES_13G097101v8 [Manihot esculenta]